MAASELYPYRHFNKHLAHVCRPWPPASLNPAPSRPHSLARSTPPPPTCAPTLPRSSTSRASVLLDADHRRYSHCHLTANHVRCGHGILPGSLPSPSLPSSPLSSSSSPTPSLPPPPPLTHGSPPGPRPGHHSRLRPPPAAGVIPSSRDSLRAVMRFSQPGHGETHKIGISLGPGCGVNFCSREPGSLTVQDREHGSLHPASARPSRATLANEPWCLL
jgi:hypothetical protein